MKILRARYGTSLIGFVLALCATLSTEAATLTVTSGTDGGGTCPGTDCTLRQAIAIAVTGDTINFAAGLTAITLTSGELLINKNLSITGPGANLLTIQRAAAAGTPEFRIVTTAGGFTYNISGLTIANGSESQGGGGIYNDASALIITSCTISGNEGAGGGGGGILNAGALTVIRSTISGNSSQYGGGIFNTGGTTSLTNSTVSNNIDSDVGGGVLCSGGVVNLTNCTIATNSADEGGGVYRFGGTINVRNTIIALNAAAIGPDFSGTLTSKGFNLIGNTTDTTIVDTTTGNQLNVDPLLGSLQDNGGPTKTHLLFSGSTAIDKGHATGSNIDQRGLPRPVDRMESNATGGDGSDIGAVELPVPPQQTGPTFTVTTTLERNQGGCAVDDCSLIEALNLSNAVADANTINFAPGLTGAIGTAILTPIGLTISNPVTINGPGARKLTITGRTAARVFRVLSANVKISGLSIVNGKVTNDVGGAIHNTGGLTLTDCTINNSVAASVGNGGGVFNGSGAALTLIGCSLTNNLAGRSGGGLYNDGIVTATNCTFSADSALLGGGIYSSFNDNLSKVTLRNCTITACNSYGGNTASGDGGGGFYAQGNNQQYRLSNSIIAGNVSSANPSTNPDLRGNFTSDGHNFIGDVGYSAGFSNNEKGDQVGTLGALKNPLLNPLGNNGGPTDTHALQSGSTARDNGDDTLAPARDQRGYARNGLSDMGAFEFGGPVPSTLANISTRLRVETGDNVLFGGFIITGTQAKKLIVRAIGPSISVPGQLDNPTLELYSGSTLLASNDNWGNSPQKQAIVDSTIPPANNLESAIVRSLAPGSYTTIVRGVNQATGVGLVEVYDLDASVDSKLAQISTRGFVQTDDNAMFGGLYVVGGTSQKVIVRAIGPSLSLQGKLADPTLELYDGNGTSLGANDNWRTGSQEAEIIATTVPPSDNLESAIVRTLTPGPYTAIVRGVNNSTGIALVEVYALP